MLDVVAAVLLMFFGSTGLIGACRTPDSVHFITRFVISAIAVWAAIFLIWRVSA